MKFSYSDIKNYCDELHNIAKNIKATMDKIEDVSESLSKSGDWDGESFNNYKAKLKKVILNFEDIYKEIEMAILYLAYVSDGYEALEKSLASEICENLNIMEPSFSFSKIFPWR